jgi:hypothetical protein
LQALGSHIDARLVPAALQAIHRKLGQLITRWR